MGFHSDSDLSLSLCVSSEKWLIIPHQSNEESDSVYLTGLSWGLNNMVWYASLSSWHQSKLSINVHHCGCCGKTFYDMDTHLSSLVSLQALLLPSLNSISISSKLVALPSCLPKAPVLLLPRLLDCSVPPSTTSSSGWLLFLWLTWGINHFFQEAFLDLNFLG